MRYLLLALAAACSGAAAKPATAPVANTATPPDAPTESAGMPDGYVAVTVGGVVALHGSDVVVLLDPARERLLPIVIGGPEAVSIHLRLSEAAAPRPLTHDLLDEVMRRMGGSLVKVQIDELRDGVFIGSLFVREDDRIFKVDSRASDAVALAIGAGVPIYVALPVLDEGGISKDDVPTTTPTGPPT
jgi:bifunctional DNase/RNase